MPRVTIKVEQRCNTPEFDLIRNFDGTWSYQLVYVGGYNITDITADITDAIKVAIAVEETCRGTRST